MLLVLSAFNKIISTGIAKCQLAEYCDMYSALIAGVFSIYTFSFEFLVRTVRGGPVCCRQIVEERKNF